jgi:NADH:ubiquinone oxidoreductase subunit
MCTWHEGCVFFLDDAPSSKILNGKQWSKPHQPIYQSKAREKTISDYFLQIAIGALWKKWWAI